MRFVDWLTDVDHEFRGAFVFVLGAFAASIVIVIFLSLIFGGFQCAT